MNQQLQHRQAVVAPKQAMSYKHLEGVLTRLIDEVDRQAHFLKGDIAVYNADPSSGASQGKSCTSVRLEKAEKLKARLVSIRVVVVLVAKQNSQSSLCVTT